MDIKNNILIVDDEEVNHKIFTDILGGMYELAHAESGEEAIELLIEFCPNLVLLDIMMPGMNGFEVCELIREDLQFQYVNIIMVSAKNEKLDQIKGYEVGANDYVTKPFDKDLLLKKVAVYLDLKSIKQDESQVDRSKFLLVGFNEL